MDYKTTNEKFTILVKCRSRSDVMSLVIEKTNHDMFHLNFDGFNFHFESHNVLHYLRSIQSCIYEDFRNYSQRIDVICPIFPCTSLNISQNKTLVSQLFCIWNTHLIKVQQQNLHNFTQSLINDGNFV